MAGYVYGKEGELIHGVVRASHCQPPNGPVSIVIYLEPEMPMSKPVTILMSPKEARNFCADLTAVLAEHSQS